MNELPKIGTKIDHPVYGWLTVTGHGKFGPADTIICADGDDRITLVWLWAEPHIKGYQHAN